MKILKLACLLLVVCCCCCSKSGNDAYLQIRYRHPGAHFPMTIPCPNMEVPGDSLGWNIWYDFKITDENLLKKFSKSYLRLKPDEKREAYIDTEACILFHHEGQVDTLCISRFGHTVLNGVRQTDNQELYLLIQDSIERNFKPIRKEMHKRLQETSRRSK